MARFVLVAGAWHGAWTWEFVIPRLQAAGHRVETAELPGMGADRTPLAGLDLMAWARAVARVIEADPEPVILVGHSRGGAVISQTAELVPDRIRLSVYLTAILLEDGETPLAVTALLPPGGGPAFAPEPTADGLAYHHDARMLREAYHLTAPDRIEQALGHLTPEPHFALTSTVSLSAARYGRVRRAYIECLQDRTVILPLQRAMQARQPCEFVRTIDTDHSPAFSTPERLAATLDELAACL